MFFGALIGISILLSALYASGMFSEDSSAADSVPTGMEILETYACDRAETKVISLGGAEDYFDLSGSEPSNPSQKSIRYLLGIGENRVKSDVVKTYDDPAQDRLLSDRFEIPKRTFHGLMAVRLKELSDLRNDGINIGYKINPTFPYINRGFGYRIDVSDLPTAKEWDRQDTLFFASLGNLEVGEPTDQIITIIDAIRTQEDTYGDFFVEIADDTVVDFVGFALCLEPEEALGTVYGPKHISKADTRSDMGLGIVGLFQSRVDGYMCSYGGCLSCEARRPVACIRDENMPIPDHHNSDLRQAWTGGEFGFTRAVKGSKFPTEDDVDQFCAAEFGSDWRALSRHDGHWGGLMSGTGTFPPDYDQAWVNLKTSSHANCWETRPDYEAR